MNHPPATPDPPAAARTSVLVRLLRLVATLALLVGSIWLARVFARRAVQPVELDSPGGTVNGTPLAVSVDRQLRSHGQATTLDRANQANPPDDDAGHVVRLTSLVNDLLGRAPPAVATATQPSGLEPFLGLLAAGAAEGAGRDPPDVPRPPGATRLLSQGNPPSLLAIYRAPGPIPSLRAFFEREMPHAGWTSQVTRGDQGDGAQWFGRYSAGGRACMVLCTHDRPGGDALVVVQTQGASGAP